MNKEYWTTRLSTYLYFLIIQNPFDGEQFLTTTTHRTENSKMRWQMIKESKWEKIRNYQFYINVCQSKNDLNKEKIQIQWKMEDFQTFKLLMNSKWIILENSFITVT